MTLELNPGLRGKLERLVTSVLSTALLSPSGSIRVRDFWGLNDDGNAALLSLKGEMREELESWLGDGPIFNFVFSSVIEELFQSPSDLRAPNAPLTSVPGFEDPPSKARKLVDALTALPHEYALSFSLPQAMSRQYQAENYPAIEAGPLAIAGSWHARTSTAFPTVPTVYYETEQSVPRNALSALASYGTADEVRERLQSLSVQIRVPGFIQYLADEPILRARAELKALVGLSLATDLLEDRGFGLPAGPDCQTNAHLLVDSVWVSHESNKPLDGIGGYLKRLQFKADQQDIPGRLAALVLLFGLPHVGGRLKLAGRWIFDAYANGDSVMRFMQFAIAMEVLLQSDAGDNGLTKMLSNRCAYLVARSAKERDALRVEFGHLYGLRSKIVHNGTDRLTEAEHKMARRFQEICGEVVKAELRLALADTR